MSCWQAEQQEFNTPRGMTCLPWGPAILLAREGQGRSHLLAPLTKVSARLSQRAAPLSAACLGAAERLQHPAGGERVPSCGRLLGNPIQADSPRQIHAVTLSYKDSGKLVLAGWDPAAASTLQRGSSWLLLTE